MVDQTHRYRFGQFEVDPEAAELKRAGDVIHLEPKVFQVLVYLLEHRGRVVEKSELLDAVWTEAFITENALTKAIGRLRHALGDDAHDARFIQTLHKVGYRFIAEVDERGPSVAEPEPAVAEPHRAPRRWLPVVVGLLAMAAAVAFVLRQSGRRHTAETEPESIRSLAVLPLQNLTGDPEQEYLVAAIHDTLIGELAQLAPLRVISRQSALRYRDSGKSVPEIARELDVDALIEGSVMRSEERVRVNAQLVHGPRDEHLWSGTFDRATGDVLQLVSDVAVAIGAEIEVAIAPDSLTGSRSWRLPSSDAEDAYLRARYVMSLATPAGLAEAKALFEQVIAVDPDFAPAWTGLGTVAFLQGMLGHLPHAEAASECKRATNRALALDPDLPEALAGLGMVRLYYEWDWAGAGEPLARAVEMWPHEALLRHGYGDYLLVTGRLEESLEQVKLGRQFDPASPIAVAPVVAHLLFLGRYEEAVEEAESLLAADPDMPVVESFLFSALWEMGDYDRALDLLAERWRERDPPLAEALSRGRRPEDPVAAMLVLADALARRPEDGRSMALSIAACYARGGKPEQAFEFLEVAYEQRQPTLLHLAVNPAFESLHSDPRFDDLLRRIGLPTPSGVSAAQASVLEGA